LLIRQGGVPWAVHQTSPERHQSFTDQQPVDGPCPRRADRPTGRDERRGAERGLSCSSVCLCRCSINIRHNYDVCVSCTGGAAVPPAQSTQPNPYGADPAMPLGPGRSLPVGNGNAQRTEDQRSSAAIGESRIKSLIARRTPSRPLRRTRSSWPRLVGVSLLAFSHLRLRPERSEGVGVGGLGQRRRRRRRRAQHCRPC
jgi:hypothetical protein